MELFREGDQVFVTDGDMTGQRGKVTAVWPARELTGFNRAEYRVRFEDGTRHTFGEDDIELLDIEMLPVSDGTILESGCRLINSEGESFLEKADVGSDVGDLELAIWPHDNGLPHVHFYFRGQDMEYAAPNGARPWGGCLCLEHARYFDHGSHRQIMDETQMAMLMGYLLERCDADVTNWQRIISLWNESNPGGKQVPITAEIPEYRWNMSSTSGAIEQDSIDENERERLIEEAFERIIMDESINDETFSEMATVGSDTVRKLRVTVTPDIHRIGDPYFKVFNTSKLTTDSAVARCHFKDDGMEYHSDKYKDWVLKGKAIRLIQDFMMEPHEDFPEYTNWQMACYLWNHEFSFTDSKQDYFAGKVDEEFKDHPSYVKHDQEMPDTWIYNPSKHQGGKRKGKGM